MNPPNSLAPPGLPADPTATIWALPPVSPALAVALESFGPPGCEEPFASIGAKVFSLPSHSIVTSVGPIATIFAAPTVSPTLYHLSFISTSLPNIPQTSFTGCCLGGDGTNKLFFFSSSASSLYLAKYLSISLASVVFCAIASLTMFSALAVAVKKPVTLTKIKTAKTAETPSRTTETNSFFSFR